MADRVCYLCRVLLPPDQLRSRDLGCENEIIFTEAANRVRGQFYPPVPIAGDVQVGMMAIFFDSPRSG